MITRPVVVTLPEYAWDLLDKLEYTLEQRVLKEGGRPVNGVRRILSAVITEVLSSHGEDILRDYEESRRDRLLVRIADLNRRYNDPTLGNAVRADGGGAIYVSPEETEGPL